MKNIYLKSSQKLIDISKVNILIPRHAEDALTLWQRFRCRSTQIDFFGLNKFYRPPLRLIEGSSKSILHFINDFARVDNILISSSSDKYSCIITPESVQDIQMLSWGQVVKLALLKDVHHHSYLKHLSRWLQNLLSVN